MSHRVEVTKLRARIVSVRADTLDVDLFLRQGGARAEHLGERLNEAGVRFLPVEVKGRPELVQLSWIAYFEVWGQLPEVEELDAIGACREPVVANLVSGDSLRGDLVFLLPAERSRVSDLLNSDQARFFLLAADEQTRYVNTDAIARVRLIRRSG